MGVQLGGLAGPETGVELPGEPQPATAAPVSNKRWTVVLWRGIPWDESKLATVPRLRLGKGPVLEAGGIDHKAEVDAREAAAPQTEALLLVAEAYEAPDKAVRRYLGEWRKLLASNTHIVVLLAGEVGGEAVSGDDISLWSRSLARLEDPYLAVEAFDEPAAIEGGDEP